MCMILHIAASNMKSFSDEDVEIGGGMSSLSKRKPYIDKEHNSRVKGGTT